MVDMSGEQSVQFVLGGNASQRNEADHIAAATLVFPVLIPDESDNMHPETSHLSLEAKSSSSNSTEQTVVRRKRGRPRKMKPSEEQSQSGKQIEASSSFIPNQQQPGAAVKSGRPKRSEQTTTKRDLGGPPGGAGGGGETSAPVKRSRGRPKKVATSTETSQSQVLGLQAQPPTTLSRHQPIISSEGITTHGSTDIFNAVQQLAQDAVIVSAIHGTPVQVLPTTAVAPMNTIDAESPLRVSAPISVTISPTREDTGIKWNTSAVTSTPPSSRTTDEREKRGYGMPLHVYQLGANTPPLLHAEQPEILNSLPQCSLSSGEVSVKIVDRLAAGPKEGAGDSRSVVEEVRHDTRYLKQPEEGMTVIKRKGTKVNTITGTSKVVIDSGNQSTKTQEQAAEVKPPQLDPPPVKRKRGRPPKSKSTSQQSTSAQEQPTKKDTVSSVPLSCGEITEKKAEPSVEAPMTATDQPVVKHKTGRPPKVKTPKTPSESPVVPPPPPEATTATITSATVSVNGEESKKPRKRGRPPKSTKAQVQTTEASGEVTVKRGRGRPRKYPIPAVAASGPFLPSVSGVTLPAASQNEEQTPTQGNAPPPQIKSKQQQPPPPPEGSQDSPATATIEAPVSRKRGRPPKNPDGPPPAKRKPGRPRVLPSPDLTPQKRGRPRKNPPEPAQDPSPPRKRGRPPRANPSPPDPSPRKRGRPKRNPTPDLSPQKQGRPRKSPGEESAPPSRKPGRPKKNPPVPDNEKVSENQSEQQNEKQETEKLERQVSPKVTAQKETSPIIDVEEIAAPQPKRKRGRPKKIPPPVVPPPLQEPTSLSSLVRESSSLLPGSGAEKVEEEEDDRYSGDVVNLSLQISFSDSDSEHSEKMESNAIMALADRVVAPSPSPPRERDSPLLNPSFEESYDEDSDPDSK